MCFILLFRVKFATRGFFISGGLFLFFPLLICFFKFPLMWLCGFFVLILVLFPYCISTHDITNYFDLWHSVDFTAFVLKVILLSQGVWWLRYSTNPNPVFTVVCEHREVRGWAVPSGFILSYSSISVQKRFCLKITCQRCGVCVDL